MIVQDGIGFDEMPGGNLYIGGFDHLELSDLQELASLGYMGKSFWKKLKRFATAPLRTFIKYTPGAKQLAKHDILLKAFAKIEPGAKAVLKEAQKKKHRAPAPAASPQQTVPVPANASPTPFPGAWFVQGNDGTGTAQMYYFPDQASATAYAQALISTGGQAQISQVPSGPFLPSSNAVVPTAYPPGALPVAVPGNTSSSYVPLGPEAPESGGETPEETAPSEEQLGPAADTGTQVPPPLPSIAPSAVTAAPVTIAPATEETGTPWYIWAGGATALAAGFYFYAKKYHPKYLPETLR